MIDFLAASKEPDYGISDESEALLVQVSGAQIDRLLASRLSGLYPEAMIKTCGYPV
jgi:hypothetical protein